MNYEKTPINKKPSKTAVKKQVDRELNQFGTVRILWHLIKRHKVALLAVGNVVLVLNFVFPEWSSIVLSLLGR